MKPRIFIFVVISVAVLSIARLHVVADPGTRVFRASLDGYHETPSISTNGSGTFQAKLNPTEDELSYELQFSGLEGGNTLFAHVHIGQVGTAGGVMFFLCGGGGKPACPNGQGTVTGTVNASEIIGPSGQGVAPGQFMEAISAMRAGAAYANVHSVVYPAGEIRGQINANAF
jgi:CHRD domain